jgi:hypothetical protein
MTGRAMADIAAMIAKDAIATVAIISNGAWHSATGLGSAGVSRMSSAVRLGCHLARSAASLRTTARCDGLTNQRTSKTMPKTEADLLELMRADRVVLNQRQADQAAVDVEASRERIVPVRIERVSRRRKTVRSVNDRPRRMSRPDQRHEQRVFEVVVEGVPKTLNGASCQRAKPLSNIILG